MAFSATHAAVVTAAIRAPLQVIQVPTVRPGLGEVLVKVIWTASTPLGLHQNDGGLLVKHPQILDGSIAGEVVQLGPGIKNLKLGDKVFGFGWREQKEKAHQELVTIPEFLLGKIPKNYTLQQAVTVPDNLVTAFHSLTTDLSLTFPWPRPSASTPSYQPPAANSPILIWGGSSSVGQYALQILTHWGYTNLIATSSPVHHTYLRSLGASHAFDYRNPDVSAQVLEFAGGNVPFILDCIGHQYGSLAQISKIAKPGSKVAVMLPVIVKDATETEAPVYEMDAGKCGKWEEGVDVRGVRTHFYLENEFYKDHLQSEIIPILLAEGVVKPNKAHIVEEKTLLERAQKAMDALRRKEMSGERLVWRLSE